MIWGVSPPRNRHWNSTYILKKNKYILKKNKYIFSNIFSKGNPNPNHIYHDLHISLGSLGKWFELFSHFKIDFGTSCTFLRKIKIFFTKISTFFSWSVRTPITLIMTYIFLWGPSGSDLMCFPTQKKTLEPHVHLFRSGLKWIFRS